MNPLVIQSPDHTSPSGYAEFGVNLLCEFYRRGVDVTYAPVWWDPLVMPLPDRKLSIIHDLMAQGAHLAARQILYLQLPDQPQPEPSKLSVIYTMFETDGLPLPWVNRLNEAIFDEVWVPSTFNVRTFSRSGVRRAKVHPIPIGIDLLELEAPFRKRQQTRADILRDHPEVKTLFFASMQGQPRKNLEGLTTPFFKAFKDRPDVALFLKCYGIPGLAQRVLAARTATLGEGATSPKILISDQVLPIDRAHDLLFAADAYVSQSHGEGADLMALKAAAMGMPVIVPAWGGYLEYVDPEAWYAIPVAHFADAGNPGVVTDRYYQGQLWANLNPEIYREALTLVASTPTSMLPGVDALKTKVRANHDVRETVERMIERFDYLNRRPESIPVPESYARRTVPADTVDGPDGSRIRISTTYADPIPIMLIPSPNQPCGIWDAGVTLAQAIPGGCFISGRYTDAFQTIENNGAELVHLQLEYGFFHPTALERLLRRLREYRVKIVVTMHSFAPEVPHNEIIREWADHVIFHNPDAKAAWKGEASFIPLPFKPVQEKLARVTKRNQKIVGTFGFSFRHKGVREWAVAMKALRNRIPKLHGIAVAPVHPVPNASTIVLTDWLKATGAASFISLIHQYLPEEALLKTLCHADLLVFPYRDTNWLGASAALRTLAQLPLPILVTDTPFFADLNTEVWKMPVADLDDPEAFADRIQACLDDAETGRFRVAQMKVLAESAGLAEVARQTKEEVYDHLLGLSLHGAQATLSLARTPGGGL